jgi:hypothetical protein
MEKEESSQKKGAGEKQEPKHISHTKHYFIKSHKSHKWIIGFIIAVMFIMGYGLYSKVMEIDSISDNNFRIMTVGLLFSLNIIVMLLIILVAIFYIEVKDKYLLE